MEVLQHLILVHVNLMWVVVVAIPFYMNFMDYTNDNTMVMFSADQGKFN